MTPAGVVMFAALLISCSPSPRNPPVEVRRAWPVMGTMLTVTAWSTDSARALQAVKAGRAAISRIDSLMSSYRDASDVTLIARNAGSAVHVSPETIHVLLLARRYWKMSQGKFDPTIGPLTELWAGALARGTLPARGDLDAATGLVGFSRVIIDSAASTVELPMKGMRIDLGGIAKGYALDQARAAMRDYAEAGIVDIGGNVLVFGRSPEPNGKWTVGIVNPRDRDGIVGTVLIDSGAVATSGDSENFSIVNGRRYSHIIDPFTGLPAQGVVSATAIGPRGEWSDGMSATLFLLGPAAGIRAADSVGSVGAVVITDPGSLSITRKNVFLSWVASRVFNFDPLFQ